MAFVDHAALERELQTNLKHGRVFVPGASELAVLDDCVLVLVRPSDQDTLALPAQAVLVSSAGAMCGVGVQLKPFNASVIATLTEFVAKAPAPVAAPTAEPAPSPNAADRPGASVAPSATDDPVAEHDAPEDAEPLADDAEDEGSAEDLQRQPARHERLRGLNLSEQIKLARQGELNDRTMLERLYGKSVWEALLHNPKLTLPEVASIARKGSVPRPLIEYIVDNNAWVQSALVRRALLTNPRVSSEGIMKLLRMTPKHELRTIYKTTTYSSQVREAARKALEQ